MSEEKAVGVFASPERSLSNSQIKEIECFVMSLDDVWAYIGKNHDVSWFSEDEMSKALWDSVRQYVIDRQWYMTSPDQILLAENLRGRAAEVSKSERSES